MQSLYSFRSIESVLDPSRRGEDELGEDLGGFLDRAWYLERYPDVAAAGLDPLEHYLRFGIAEHRDPNPLFDASWYLEQNPDVAECSANPLLHYFQHGAAELRNPHPRFDASYYVSEHPEALGNPLMYHLRTGAARGYATEKVVDIGDFLPSDSQPLPCPDTLTVDVIIPVYRGLEQTKRCLASVLDDADRLPGKVIVIDDRSPERKLSSWLAKIAASGAITLLRNPENRGFVASVNRGMAEAGRHDVVLLNSDVEVPRGWLRRLAAQAYSASRIGSVSPMSNNATICSYPAISGGPLALGRSVADLDGACQEANAGRSVDLPTTVGFCMYIRRACLDEVGRFDEQAFRRGYGEENDFCMRAAMRRWQHLLACDTFVYHEGEVSFGKDSPELRASRGVLLRRHPDYERAVARHVRLDAAGPFRFAITAALFRASGLPTILLVSHGLGGGVQRHLERLRAGMQERANFLLLEPASAGVALSVPDLPGHPQMQVAEGRVEDLAAYLRSAGVTRVHLHHVLGFRLDVRLLIHTLAVPFDFTMHDYFAICPRVNLLPTMDSQYCGEPEPAACNACIGQRFAHGARDIQDWRHAHKWMFQEAECVICPSEDVRKRLVQYRLDRNARVIPHEAVAAAPWPMRPEALGRRRTLRVAIIGVLANQKGAPAVIALAERAAAREIELHLIGYPEEEIPEPARERIKQTGRYDDPDLPALLARVRPHVLWFPAQWPETYSYTLSAAIETGLPIVASNIGALPERLAGRPLTWLVDPAASAERWIETFRDVRTALRHNAPEPGLRTPQPDLAPDFYIRPASPAARRDRLIDLRRPGHRSVVLVPERLDTGCLSPCAYIRLLLPFDHPAISDDTDVILATAEEAMRYRPDVIATHRHAMANLETADALTAHCQAAGITLLYDLDDDLIDVPLDHPDAKRLAARAPEVRRMIGRATRVWVSTPALRGRVLQLRTQAVIVPNGLDERLWLQPPVLRPAPSGPVRILFMGTATHDADLALIEPALERLHTEFGDRVSVDIIGVTLSGDLPAGSRRLGLPSAATASYPGFVNWIVRENRWDFGLAPLVDTPFSACKSSIKAMDYAALGMPTLASDIGVYRGSVADNGRLVANTGRDWYQAIADLVRDPVGRERLAFGARAAYARSHTLAAQRAARRAAWDELFASSSQPAPEPQTARIAVSA